MIGSTAFRFPSNWDTWDYEPRPKSAHSREKSANRKRNNEKYKNDRQPEINIKGKEWKEAKQKKKGKIDRCDYGRHYGKLNY